MARGSASHRRAAMIHALNRFHQRVGIRLPFLEYERMCNIIRDGGAPHVALTADNVRIFHVRYAGRSAYAVFKIEVGRIATFYPSIEWVLKHGGKMVDQRVTA